MLTIELFEIALKNIYEKKGERIPDFITRLIQETKAMEFEIMDEKFNKWYRAGFDDAISCLARNRPTSSPNTQENAETNS